MSNLDLCQHPSFEANVLVARIEDGGRFSANVQVRCTACGVRFRWMGFKMGAHPTKAMVSVDQFELRAPIEPDAHMTSLMAGDGNEFPAVVYPCPARTTCLAIRAEYRQVVDDLLAALGVPSLDVAFEAIKSLVELRSAQPAAAGETTATNEDTARLDWWNANPDKLMSSIFSDDPTAGVGTTPLAPFRVRWGWRLASPQSANFTDIREAIDTARLPRPSSWEIAL